MSFLENTANAVSAIAKKNLGWMPAVTIPYGQQNPSSAPPVTISASPQQQSQARVVSQPQGQPVTMSVPGQQQPTGNQYDPLWQNTNRDVAQRYTDTLSGALSGRMYDPFAAGQREAEARAEANQRSGTAAQVASAGFSGTGIGRQIGSATEDQLLKQRFDTNIGIEQARNASRVGALGEARAYAGANQQEAQTALNNALQFGSDEDVGKAYTAMTGKTLDPMAIQQYRGSQRTITQQGIQGTQNTLDAAARENFAATIQNIPANQPITAQNVSSMPDVMAQAQKAWQAQGGQGNVSPEWAAQMANNVRQSSDPAVVAANSIDYEAQQGIYTPEEASVAKNLLSNKAVLAAFKKDDKGNYVPDTDALEKALGLPPGTLGSAAAGTTTGQGGVSVAIPTSGPGMNSGEAFVGSDGQIWVNEGGTPTSTSATEVTWDNLKGQPSDSAAVQAVLAKTDSMSNQDIWKDLNTLKSSKTLVRVNGPDGKPTLARVVASASEKQGGGHSRFKHIQFERPDGSKFTLDFKG